MPSMLRCSIRNAQMDLRLMTYFSSAASGAPPPAPAGRLRRLGPADSRHLQAHLLRLHPDDLRHRFMGGMPRSLVHRYVRAIDWQRAIIVGCFFGRSLRGVCELYPIGGSRAEVAVSVERRFQGRGIGEALVGRILILARNRCYSVLEFRCMAGNQRMRGLVGKFDSMTLIDSLEAEATVRALPPTPATYGIEMVEQADAFGNSLIRFWLDNAGRTWPGRCWTTPDLFRARAEAGG